MPRANWDVLCKYNLVIPGSPLVKEFNNLKDDIIKELHVLMMKNQNLRKTRDMLLPKLISGELDVENLDIDTGEVFVES
jgi:type I restriction enzyme S subunit